MIEIVSQLPPEAVSGSTNVLLQQGVSGVAIIALIVFVIYLLRKLDQKDVIIRAIQQQRVDDMKEAVDKTAAPLKALAESSEGQSTVLDKIWELLRYGSNNRGQ